MKELTCPNCGATTKLVNDEELRDKIRCSTCGVEYEEGDNENEFGPPDGWPESGGPI